VEIRAPAEQTEGTRSQLLRWLKNVGEPVVENEPLIEIETDKVTVEVASPGAGILLEIVKGEQEEIVPGEVLGRIESRSTVEVPALAAAAFEHAPVEDDPGTAVLSGASPVTTSANFAAGRLSPAVRRLLDENSLEPSGVRGTGLGGRITVEDVLAAIAARPGAGAAYAHGTAASPVSVVDSAPTTTGSDVSGGSHRIPHTAVRKRIAEHMVRSLLHTAPHVTTVFELDMTAVLAHRAQHRDEFARRGVPLTLTAYFLQGMVSAVSVVPEANSCWTDSALEVFESIHIGVATALDKGGLVVPVLRDVQSRDLFSTAQGLDDLVTRAREGELRPEDVRGGTITISNHGVSGSLLATPIVINQPQVAILGVGKLEKRSVVVEERGEDRVAVQPRCYITLTIDHRVMDGHQANRFLQTFVARLTHWAEEPV
jgi:2-oxoglutarate dehydrogenase E2 component (dihydrolipoamide succinyltransferase)